VRSIADLYNDFVDMEKELNLFHRRIGGVHFWERVRAPIFLYIFEKSASGDSRGNRAKPSMRDRIMFFGKAIVDIRRNPFLTGRKDIVFFSSQRRTRMEDGLWWEIYTDPVAARLKLSSVTIEPGLLTAHRVPAKTKNLRYLDFVEFGGYVLQKLGFGRVELEKKDKELLATVEKEIRRRFGVLYDVRRRVKLTLVRRKTMLPLLKWIMKLIRPKLAVVVTAYGKETIVEAAKSLGITVVELQHGVISPYHPGYSYPQGIKKKTFPDYLLVFGEYWRTCTRYPIPRSRVLPVGYPYLESRKRKYEGLKRKRQVVVISQARLGREIAQFAAGLRKVAPDDLKIVYKLHPMEIQTWRHQYPWLSSSGIHVVGTEGDLYQLFAESVAQVGVFSTALYEGLSFGLRTFLIDLPGVEYMTHLIETGIARMVSTANEVVEHLQDLGAEAGVDNEYFFRSGALSLLVRTIEQLAAHETPTMS